MSFPFGMTLLINSWLFSQAPFLCKDLHKKGYDKILVMLRKPKKSPYYGQLLVDFFT